MDGGDQIIGKKVQIEIELLDLAGRNLKPQIITKS
jgi:hypothetical protein